MGKDVFQKIWRIPSSSGRRNSIWVPEDTSGGGGGGNTVAHGDSTTITGSGFGSMPSFSFTGGSGGLIEAATIGQKPSGVAAFATGWCWDRFNQSGVTCLAFNDTTRGKVVRINDTGDGEVVHEYTWSPTTSPGGKIMIKYYGRYSATSSGSTDRQIKMMRMCAGASDIVDSGHNFLYTQRNDEEWLYVNSAGGVNSDTWEFGTETVRNGSWQRFEFKFAVGTQGNRDGKVFHRRNMNGSYLVDTSDNGRALQSQVYNYPDSNRYGSVMWQNWWGNGYTDADFAQDDHYVQFGSYKCVELWNSLTPGSASIREIQKPTSWSDGSITVQINRGGLSNGNYFLVVLDDTDTDSVLASKVITLV